MNLIERETHTHTPTKKTRNETVKKKRAVVVWSSCCSFVATAAVCAFFLFFLRKRKNNVETHTRTLKYLNGGGRRHLLTPAGNVLGSGVLSLKIRKEKNEINKEKTKPILSSARVHLTNKKLQKKNRRKWKKRKSVPTFGFSLFLFASPVRLVVPKSFFSPFDCKSNSQPTRLQGGQTKRRFGFQIFFASIANADGQQKRNRWPLNTRTRAKGRNKKSENETNKIRQRRRGAKRESNDPALP